MGTSSSTSVTQTPDNRVHLFRLQILIIDGGLLVLRNILDQTLAAQGITLCACLNNEKSTITRLKRKGIITQVQYDTLFPIGGVVPNTADLDITIIILVLRCLRCFGLNTSFDWNTTPQPTDVSLEADLWRLKNYRNKLFHISTTKIVQQNEFLTLWNKIEQILVRLSPPAFNIHHAIADYKTCPIDKDEENRIQIEIVKWKNYESKVDQLDEDVNVLKTDIDDLKRRREEDAGKVEDLCKKVEDLLANFGNDRNITRKIKVFDSELELRGNVMDEPIINWLENLIIIACNVKRNTKCPEKDKELLTKLIEFLSRLESKTGAKVIDGSNACIIIKLRCESNEQVLKLLQYFDSDDLKYQLEELAEIVKRRIMTEEHIQVSFHLSRNCLETILDEIEEIDFNPEREPERDPRIDEPWRGEPMSCSWNAAFKIKNFYPEREPERDKKKTDKPWRGEPMSWDNELEEKLIEEIENITTSYRPNLLLTGTVGAGKSSFINAVLSIDGNSRVAIAPTGTVFGPSWTFQFSGYRPRLRLKNFILRDTTSICQNLYHGGLHIDDFCSLVNGHIENNYKFDPEIPITSGHKSYRENPDPEHVSHCVIFVINADVVYNETCQSFQQHIRQLQQRLREKRIPRVLVLTKADIVCEEVSEDKGNIFYSRKIQKTVKLASDMFDIEPASIHPVVNYENDYTITAKQNIAILLALKQSLQNAVSRIREFEDDEEIPLYGQNL